MPNTSKPSLQSLASSNLHWMGLFDRNEEQINKRSRWGVGLLEADNKKPLPLTWLLKTHQKGKNSWIRRTTRDFSASSSKRGSGSKGENKRWVFRATSSRKNSTEKERKRWKIDSASTFSGKTERILTKSVSLCFCRIRFLGGQDSRIKKIKLCSISKG